MPQLLPMLPGVAAGATATGAAATVAGLSTAGAVSAAGAGIFAKASLTKFLISTASSIALNALSMALMPKPAVGGAGISTDGVKMGADVPRSFILGTYATSCSAIAPAWVWDIDKDDNKYLTLLYNISDAPITDVIELWIDGRKYNTLPQVIPPAHFDDKLGMKIDGGDQRGWVLFENGYQTEANPMLRKALGDFPERPYTSDMKLTGVSYLIATFKHLNADPKYTQIPDVRVVVKGKPLYDPRKDSTNGGSGSHRWGNETTYEHTNNPAVMAYNLFRGISMSPTEIYGVMAPAEALPSSYWFPAMNTCDEAGTEPSSTYYGKDKKRYQGGIEISVDAEPLDEIERILVAAGAVMAEIGGQYLITVGAPNLPVAHITDNEIIHDASSEFIVTEGLNSIYNGVTARYPSPNAGWESEVATPLLNPVWEAEDMGRRLLANIDYSTVYVPRQVRRLMRELAADNRRQRRHTIVLSPTYLGLNPTDSITWTSTTNGYSSKVFEVISTSIDPDTLAVLVELRERDPNDYDYDEVSDARTPITPSPVVVYPINTGVKGFGAIPFTLKDASGKKRRPAIKLVWNAEVGYSSFQYQIRVAGSADIITRTIQDASRGEAVVTDVLPNTAYQVRSKPNATHNRTTSWGAWITVTTPNAYMSGDDFEDGVIGLFEDAGLKATREIADRNVPGAYDGELAWSRADNALYMWDAASSTWKPFIERSLNEILEDTLVAQDLVGKVKVVSSLPATGSLGDTVLLSTDKKLYRWNGSAWTAAVAAVDVSGQLTNAQIADIAAAKISGQITVNQIANNAVTAVKLANYAITNSKLANNSITSVKISDGSISTPKLAAGAVVANTIAAGAVGANELAANAVTTKHLVVSDFTNLLTNSSLENVDGWSLANDGVSHTNSVPTNASQPGNLVFANTTATTYAHWESPTFVPASEGDEFWIGGYFRGSGTGPQATPRCAITYYDRNKTSITSYIGVPDSVTTNVYQLRGWASNPAPANTAFIRFLIGRSGATAGETNAMYLEAPFARRRNNADLIVDGTITGNKVQANTITGNLLVVDAVTAREIKSNVITATHMTADSITGRELKANSVSTNHLVANSVTAGIIAAGAVGADQIAARSIVASKLAIADFTNLVPDDQIQDAASWSMSSAFMQRSINGQSGIKSVGDLFFTKSDTADHSASSRNFFPVTPGDELFCSGQARRLSGTIMKVALQIMYYDKNDTLLSSNTFASIDGTSNTFNMYEGTSIVPAGAYQARFRFYVYGLNTETDGNIVFGSPTVRIKGTGKLIVDGSIEANHIKAATITGGLMAASGIITNSAQINNALITNAKIANAAVNSLKIADNALYIPYRYTRSDYYLTVTYTQSNPVVFVDHNITGFEGGAFNVSFNADLDGLNEDDTFGGFQLLVNNSVVQTSKYGVNAGGGGGAAANFLMPIIMNTNSYGTSSVNIKVRGWSFKWDDQSNPHKNFWVRNISLTVSGARR